MPFTLVSQIALRVKRVSRQMRLIIQRQAEGRELCCRGATCCLLLGKSAASSIEAESVLQKKQRCGDHPQREKSGSKNS